MKPHYYPSEIKRIVAKSRERAINHDRVLALLDSKDGIETAALADLAMLDRRRMAALLCWLERQGKVSRTLDWTKRRRVPYSHWIKTV
jgi:hypothetical protein